MIREATPGDVEGAADTLTAAFAEYPFTRHTISADDHLARLREFQRLFLAEIGLPHGRVWVSDGLDAVAVWSTPAGDAGPTLQQLLPRLVELAGDRSDAHASAEAAMEAHRPAEPVWFLGTVGVRPSAQGRGLGRAVIEPGLAAADAEGVPAFLETSTDANVGVYKALGFEITAEYDLPDGGPRTWAMLRRPSP
ncbi:GNAT family N-acetyltransferase [Nocardiopsis sp. HNM0947]|uniref:GNAT family N-acetyltransferase n=1 Tax=Nocardiopsis coralli TaxID=2772213 RepID=A0ABR9P3W1_9ACTN|nr:GNAT family N-acetyltransferase [Nocardiopsis coralli]MBE2998532.1 GNAT family N-acetyltransferase [Nocardiopsis coralli]